MPILHYDRVDKLLVQMIGKLCKPEYEVSRCIVSEVK